MTFATVTNALRNVPAKPRLHAILNHEMNFWIGNGKEMPSRPEHAIERLKVLPRRLRILAEHLADAEDGVERRAQLMAHVGEKLRLVLARVCERIESQAVGTAAVS